MSVLRTAFRWKETYQMSIIEGNLDTFPSIDGAVSLTQIRTIEGTLASNENISQNALDPQLESMYIHRNVAGEDIWDQN